MKKTIFKVFVAAIIVFAILRLTGIIQIHIPPRYYYFLLVIPLIELSAFVYIISKLIKSQRSKYPTLGSAVRAVLREKIPFMRSSRRKVDNEQDVNKLG
jgi:hypothetical protein